MRPAGATIRRGGRRVGVHVAESHPVVGHPVGPRNLAGGDDWQDDAVRRVGAGVVNEIHAQRQDPAFIVEADLDFVHLTPLLVDSGEMLLPVLGPFDRPPQLHRGEGHQQLVRVEQHDLRPEAAPHVGSDHVDARFRQPEQHRQPAADRSR